MAHVKNWAEVDLISDTLLGGWNPKANLVAHYLLDDALATTAVLDASPNSYDGTMIGGNTEDIDIAALIQDVAGNAIGSAHDFNGSTHAHNIDAAITGMTGQTKGVVALVVEPDAVADDYVMLFAFQDTDGRNGIVLQQGATDGKLAGLARVGNVIQWLFDTSNVVISNGTKTWIVLSHDGTTPKLYIGDSTNGMKEVPIIFSNTTDKTVWFSTIISNGADNGRIACWRQNSTPDAFFWNGTIDDFRIYSEPWSIDDAIGWFNNGNGTQAEAGTIPWTDSQAANFLSSTDTQSTSFTPTLGTTTFCDTNAAAGDIVVTNPAPVEADDWFEIHLKTDHATRKLTVNGEPLIIAGEFVRVVYDGAAWNNFTHLIPSQAQVYRSAAQTINHATNTLISFDAENYDVGSLGTTGTTPITIRRAGKYLITANWGTAAVMDDTEYIQTRMKINGTIAITGTKLAPAANSQMDSGIAEGNSLAAGDTVQLEVLHGEGASITTQGSPRQPTLTVQEIL